MIEAIVLITAAIPAVLFVWNLLLFRAPRGIGSGPVSVLIPARNEEGVIADAVRSVLSSRQVELEVVVLDDDSSDRTAEIVKEISLQDSRVRLIAAPPLPGGWNGKQHACHVLAQHARHDLLCFLDADVRLSPDALTRMIAHMNAEQVSLVSGFPRQDTVTFLERLLLPLIHFVLLGYLPIVFLRLTRHPGFAAGCGQLILVRRGSYQSAGGHAAIRNTMHDGIQLPRALRIARHRTDIIDATQIASCRMYRNAHEVWQGLAKNAVEGMAAPGRILIFTALLFCGQVLPFFLLPVAPETCGVAAALGLIQRLIACRRFRQPVVSALLHPAGVFVLLAVQWYALARYLRRRPATWKGRAYAS